MIGQISASTSSELAPNRFGSSSELAPNMFEASSELASVMEFGFYLFLIQHHISLSRRSPSSLLRINAVELCYT